MNDFGKCPICGEYAFLGGGHRCDPEWYVRIAEGDYLYDGDEEPTSIRAGDHQEAAEKFAEQSDVESADYCVINGNEIKVDVKRIALNMDQVEQHDPPPNPTKLSDSRAPDYIYRFGEDSWELDALEPQTIVDLIEATVLSYRDNERWANKVEEEEHHKDIIQIGLDAMPEPE